MGKDIQTNFSSISNEDLILSYSKLLSELKQRKLIRSKNVVGDLGEYLAINFYNKTAGLPKLQPAPKGTQNVDALSRDGERYSIKCTTGKVTGVFYGLPALDSYEFPIKKFEYVIIVILNDDYELIRINQLTWDEFLIYKKWHSRMKAWNIVINNSLLLKTKTMFLQANV